MDSPKNERYVVAFYKTGANLLTTPLTAYIWKNAKIQPCKSTPDTVLCRGYDNRGEKNIRMESFMCRKMGYRPTNVIAFRDDVYFYLLDHSSLPEEAWRLSERGRKGRELEIVISDMEYARDRWVLEQIEKTC